MIDKKGQLGLSIISVIVVLIVGFLMANFLFNEVTTARAGLDCTNMSISDGNKLICLSTDIVIPYWIYGVIALVIGGIIVRLAIK